MTDRGGSHPATEARPSDIAGRGLFATVAIPAGTVVLEPPEPGVPALLNHCCDPVLGWEGDALVALVDVPAGTELTTDYALVVSDPDYYLRCHCPSQRCRQMVEGSDWRIPQLQRRYLGRWAPAVQRLIDGPDG